MAPESRCSDQQEILPPVMAILLVLMIFAGILTRIIQPGHFERRELVGRLAIIPGSFRYEDASGPILPIWRWFTAPIEVSGGPDALTIISILVFLLMVGVSFAILEKCGLLQSVVANLVRIFEGRRYLLLAVICLFFMLMGAFFGILKRLFRLSL